jgi:hypothetical protein
MNRIFLTATLVSLVGFASHAQAVIPAETASQNEIIVGAFIPALVDAPLVVDAKNFAQSRIPSLTLADVNVAYTQVVNGTNIKLITTGVEDGQQVTWKFVIYKKLNGQMYLSLAERL